MLSPLQASKRLAPPWLTVAMLLVASCAPVHSHRTVQANPAPFGEMPALPAIMPPAPNNPVAMTGPARTVKIGLLLPLTGASAALGNSMLDAAMLGLFDKYNSLPDEQKNIQVELLPKDTGSNPHDAELAAKSAIQEGATLFLGPLTADNVKAVAPVARAAHVPIITFSNNPQIAGNGTYLYGFMPEQQVERVVAEAAHHSQTRIGALVPANAYGKLIAAALSRAAGSYGGVTVRVEYYPEAGEVDVAAERLYAAQNGGRKPEYDAVLIADGGDRLRGIVERLKRFGIGVNNTQLLGTGLWDDPALLADPSLAGGWFAGSPLILSSNFDKRFTASYRYHPPRLASLAYDGVALSVTLAMASAEAPFSAAALENPIGFVGPANGIFRFHGGASERGLAVLKLGPRGFEEISPAPKAFDIPLR